MRTGVSRWPTRDCGPDFGVLSTVLLKDEQAELDLAGLTLPVLKLLTTRGCAPQEGSTGEEDAALARVLNGMLSACLLNFDAVRFVVPVL